MILIWRSTARAISSPQDRLRKRQAIGSQYSGANTDRQPKILRSILMRRVNRTASPRSSRTSSCAIARPLHVGRKIHSPLQNDSQAVANRIQLSAATMIRYDQSHQDGDKKTKTQVCTNRGADPHADDRVALVSVDLDSLLVHTDRFARCRHRRWRDWFFGSQETTSRFQYTKLWYESRR